MTTEIKQDLYYKCSECLKILSAYDASLCCSSSTAYFAQWPSPLIKELLKLIGKQDLSNYNQQRIALLNLHTVLQMMMEDAIWTLSKKCSKNADNVNTVFLKNLSADAQVKYFDTLNHRPLEALLAASGHDTFLRDMDALSVERDRLVYEPDLKIKADNTGLILSLFKNCQKILAVINNDAVKQQERAKKILRKSVMVVDDEEDIRLTLSAIIEKEGVEVHLAASGEEALDIYMKKKPDLVFLDVSLPNMNGLAVLKAIKEIDEMAAVYFVSGVSGETFKTQARELGAKGHLPKPFFSKDVVSVVKRELG